MLFKRIVAVITAFLSVLFANTPISMHLADDKDIEHKYIIIQDADHENTIALIRELYGETSPENEVMYAIGVCGPLLLTDSCAVIAEKTEKAFQLALKYNVPVWFQADDVNNQYYAYNGESYVTADKWYENPENVEKLGFGEDAPLAPYWFNWGHWKKTPAMPCLNSESFAAFIKSQLQNGFLPVLKKGTNTLKELDREYLFAGVSVGWETRIPDYTGIPDGTIDQNGVAITREEQKMTGYRALENLGFKDEASIEAEADKQHIRTKQLRYNLFSQVVHDYSEMISREIYNIGIEKTKIFTHLVMDTRIIENGKNISFNSPLVSAAVNDYSTPGFTNNSNVSLNRLGTLKTKIARADTAQQHYGIVEGYAMGLNESKKNTVKYFNRLFSSGAIVVAVYGIYDSSDSPYMVPKSADAPFSQAVRQVIGSNG